MLQRRDKVFRLARLETCKRTELDDIDAMVGRAFRDYRIMRLCIDKTGMGEFPAAEMVRKYGQRVVAHGQRNKVEPVNFSETIKAELAGGIFVALNEGRLKLPRRDHVLPQAEPGTADALRKEFLSLQRVVTPKGNVVYDTPRTDIGHGDRLWSIALGIHACGQGHPMLEALRMRLAKKSA